MGPAAIANASPAIIDAITNADPSIDTIALSGDRHRGHRRGCWWLERWRI
jgi:hypothetical protein